MIEQYDGAFQAEAQVGVIYQLLHTLLFQQAVDERKIARQVVVEDHATNGGLDELAFHLHRNGVRHVLIVVRGGEVDDFTGVAQADRREQFNFAGFQSQDHFVRGAEHAAFTLGAGASLSQVINAEDHVLRRNGERQAVRRG